MRKSKRYCTKFFELSLIISLLILILLQNYLDQITTITIDTEYEGTQIHGILKGALLRHIRRIKKSFSRDRIIFQRIGKQSPAHHMALAVYRGQQAPTTRVKSRELLRYL